MAPDVDLNPRLEESAVESVGYGLVTRIEKDNAFGVRSTSELLTAGQHISFCFSEVGPVYRGAPDAAI